MSQLIKITQIRIKLQNTLTKYQDKGLMKR